MSCVAINAPLRSSSRAARIGFVGRRQSGDNRSLFVNCVGGVGVLSPERYEQAVSGGRNIRRHSTVRPEQRVGVVGGLEAKVS